MVRLSGRLRSADAFAPGHVTGIFAPALEAADPRGRGSLGAGVVLELGVHASARFSPGHRRRLRIQSDTGQPLPISQDVAQRLFAEGDGRLEVSLSHDLPIGQGFGMSAAGALATALSVSSVLDRPIDHVASTAHLADLFGGGGLGGVAAILDGGLEVRESAGIPPWGKVRHRPFGPSIVLAVFGPPIPSPALLHDARFLRQVRSAASSGISRLRRRFTIGAFLAESERFSDRLRLAPAPLAREIRSLRSPSTTVAQAMFGHSLWAVARTSSARRRLFAGLQASSLPAIEVRAAGVGSVPTVTTGPARGRRPR